MKKLDKLIEIGLSETFAQIVEKNETFDSYNSNVEIEDFYMFDTSLTSSTDVTIDIQSSSCTNYFC